jgi:hypothetical protein
MKKLLKIGCLGIVGVVVLLGVLVAIGGKATKTAPTTQQAVVAPKASEPTAAASASQPTSGPSEPEPTSAPEPTSVPEPTIAPTPAPAIGQDVRVGDIRWKVLSAENLGNTLKSDNEFIKDLKTSGVFIKVRFEIENLSNDMVSYSGADLADDKERKFKHSSEAFSFIPDEEQSLIVTNLNPNLTKTITEIYEVPANATGMSFYVGDLALFGGEEAMIDLELK